MALASEKKQHKSYGITDGSHFGKEDDNNEQPSWKFWKKRRYIVATLAFFGFFNVYCLRVNLSIAIVAMTQDRFEVLENGTKISLGPEFDWDNEMQGYILSSFFYGYITTQLLGGYLSAKFGGKTIFGAGVAVTAALTLVTPWLANTNVYLLIAVRIIEGIFEGVTYPCIHAIWSKWAPPMERSRLATIAFSGSYAGTVVAMPACAYLANAFGWPSIFYFWGNKNTGGMKSFWPDIVGVEKNSQQVMLPVAYLEGKNPQGLVVFFPKLLKVGKRSFEDDNFCIIGLIWYAIWTAMVQNSPELDKNISRAELEYILDSLKETNNNNKQMSIPWKAILSSSAVWAIVISHFSENWGFYTLLTQLPKYLKDIHDYNLGKSGFLSGLPYLVMAIMMQFSGQWADWFRVKGYLTTTQVRKIFNCSGFIAQTVFMMGAAFWSDRIGTVFCLTMAVGLGAFAWAGFSVNHLDIAPQYASVLMGIGNTIATLPGIISPILSGYVVSKPPQIHEWQIVFYISAGIYLFGAVIYGTFASGELQPWAIESAVPENDQKIKKKYGIENKTFTSDEEL